MNVNVVYLRAWEAVHFLVPSCSRGLSRSAVCFQYGLLYAIIARRLQSKYPLHPSWPLLTIRVQYRIDELSETSVKPHDEASFAASYIPGRGIHIPFLHPRTYSVPVAALHFRSHHTDLLELYTHFVSHAATALGIPISRVIKLPTQRTLWTVPKSPFAHKKSQENFERKVHKRMIKAWDAEQDVVDLWLQYAQKNSIGGVGIKIVRWERVPVGVGRMRMEGVADQWNPRAELRLELEGLGEHLNAREEIMELGQRIVDEGEER